jgi:HK97 family phage major capsid protein/HK97 family phage prohead protease
MNRAYSLIDIKSVSEETRSIEGIASTPTPDRMGDVVEPKGAKFSLPLPLLWQHNASQPVGHVTVARAGKDGISIKATLAKIDEPGPLKDIVDTAWQAVKAKLVRGLSIGFSPLEFSHLKEGGMHFTSWDWLELSLVTIPANAEATIQTVKSIDAELLAASGESNGGEIKHPPASRQQSKPVVKAKEAKRIMKKTVSEQISDLEATRAAKAAELDTVQQKALDEGRTKDAAEKEQFDTLNGEIEALDAEIADLRKLEKLNAQKARPVEAKDSKVASESRGGATYVKAPNLPKGTLFTRYAMAIAAGKGSLSDALQYAKRWDSQTPEVSAYIKAVAGSTDGGDGAASSGTWGAELVYPTNLASEFAELLMPATVIGRINGLRRVPFNVRIPTQTAGATVNWTGEGSAKPVSELDFSTVTLGYAKIAGIVALTDELVRLSSPAAEETVRRDLVEQIAKFMDEQFLDPSVTASAGVRPASITNGVSAVSSSGTDADSLYFDLNTALAAFDDAEMPDSSVHIVMRRNLARGISALRNALGQFEFPTMTPAGGTLMGYPVIVSNSSPSEHLILIAASEVLMADDGRTTLDASREATLDMSGGNSPTFSLWQKNAVGIRAERWITWGKRRSTAVAMIDGAEYGPQGETP